MARRAWQWCYSDIIMTSRNDAERPSWKFAEQVADAYEHLHDLVYLRTHPLLDQLVSPSFSGQARGPRHLHDILRNLIDELDPGSEAPSFSLEWRRHRYMVLRYLRGLTHEKIAEQLAVGLRHYYRMRREFIDDIAEILWSKYLREGAPTASQALPESQPTSELELLRLEAARSAQMDRYANLYDVLTEVIDLVERLVSQRGLEIELDLPRLSVPVLLPRDHMRQLLISLFGLIIGCSENEILRVTGSCDTGSIDLVFAYRSPGVDTSSSDVSVAGVTAEIRQFAEMCNCTVVPVLENSRPIGLQVNVPIAQSTVLVVDDNEGVLQLISNFLATNGYRALTASASADAIEIAERIQPYAITLDLMMPQRDGWEFLQMLTVHPNTSHIPIIVCSVLRQKELALSLGASAYLEKPVTEHALIAALRALQSPEQE